MNCEALETEKSEPAGNGVEENGSDRDTLHADADVVDPDIKTAECAQGAGDANASVLEAQDVTPEAIRRGRMVVGLILVLFAAAIVVLVVMPPLSWKPPKKVKQNFASLASAELVEAGQGEMRSLAYAPMGEHVFYRLSLEQDTSYAQGNQMSSKLEGRLEIFRPKRQDLADTVGLKLHDARTFVKDGDKQIEMGESAEMLGGVSLFTRLDAQDGMGLAVPESNVNPQVARVMYVLTDALRDIWIPLPKTDVGAGGSWTVTDVWDKSETYKRRAVAGVQFEAQSVAIETKYALVRRIENGEEIVGDGTSVTTLRDGVVKSGRIVLSRHGDMMAGGSVSQTIRFSLELEDGVQGP